MDQCASTLVIACGALAREIAALKRANGWDALEVRCLPAELHNRPERIAPAVREAIAANRGEYAQTFVAYGDCGTGGELDRLLREDYIVLVGGAPLNEQFANAVGADAYCRDAAMAVETAKRLIAERRQAPSLRKEAAAS